MRADRCNKQHSPAEASPHSKRESKREGRAGKLPPIQARHPNLQQGPSESGPTKDVNSAFFVFFGGETKP